MKKIELLAPAGNWDAFVAAIQAGCDAVYLAGKNFGARAFSKNFTNEEIIEAIKYAHLYGVKVYVTVNTLVYDDEVSLFLEYVEFLHKNNVDALIIQDFGMFDLVRKTFPNLELHASTQMHIHNLDGTILMEKLGMKRVVLARETSIDEIKHIKENSNVELEIFIHGALCISYSGQCLMSSLIGGRSGNRGTCAGSCRLKYDIIDEEGKKLNKFEYPLSTKELNGIEDIGKLIDLGVASLKIEGRMKSKEYVYTVVSLYRKAIDSYYKYGKVIIDEDEILKLKKIFNRDYTKGFLFNTPNDDFINGYRPNHLGVKVGKIIECKNKIAKIKLCDRISIGSGLRVIGKDKDIGISVNDFYIDGKLVKTAGNGDIITIRVNEEVAVLDDVVITLDKALSDEIEEIIDNNLRKVMVKGYLEACLNKPLVLKISDGVNEIFVYGNNVMQAKNQPTDEETIREKLNKLGDTVYKFEELEIKIDNNVFIPLKEINELRRMAVMLLDEKRLYKVNFKKCEYRIDVPDFKKEQLLACLVVDRKQYDKLDKKYDIVYCEEIVDGTVLKLPRVINEYPEVNNQVMIGEIGGFNKYKNVITDFSMNVVNSYTVAFLHSLGAKRVTLSYELNDKQIEILINNYYKRYGKHPNVELIVLAYEEVMVSKFSLNKYYNNEKLFLRDMYGNKYLVRTKYDKMYIYNYKKRDCFSYKYYEMGVNSLRFNLDK